MKAFTDNRLPLERPYAEAFAIYRRRLSVVFSIVLIGVGLGLLLICASSLQHTSPKGIIRTLVFMSVVLSASIAASHLYAALLFKRSAVREKRHEVERVQFLIDRCMDDMRVSLPPIDGKETERMETLLAELFGGKEAAPPCPEQSVGTGQINGRSKADTQHLEPTMLTRRKLVPTEDFNLRAAEKKLLTQVINVVLVAGNVHQGGLEVASHSRMTSAH